MKHIRKCYNLRTRKTPFDPDRDYLRAAIADYLFRGGKIAKIRQAELRVESPATEMQDLKDVDDFLLGSYEAETASPISTALNS